MIIKNEIEQAELAEHLDYYLNNFEHVDKLYCGSDLGEGCGELLAIVLYGGNAHQVFHPNGMIVIPVGSAFGSSRVRLDETQDGKPMLGFICQNCRNDTNLSFAEKHHPPRNGWYSDVMPHEYDQIRTAIKLCGHVANYKEESQVKHYESFRVERLK
jgi:hypothetical protein